MRIKHNLIIESSFIDSFIKKNENSNKSSWSLKKIKTINHFYDFLSSMVNLNIYTNISVENLFSENFMYKRYLNLDSNVPKVISNLFEEPDVFVDKNPFMGFTIILCDLESDKIKVSFRGQLIISLINLERYWLIIKELSCNNYSVDNVKNYEFINAFSFPCNSVMIVDPYLKKSEKTLNKNLKVILTKLLQDGNENENYNFTFFFDENLTASNVFDYKKSYEYLTKDQFIDWTNETLKELNIFNYKLTFISHKEISKYGKEHNRFIITNYWKIKAGRSFDINNFNDSLSGGCDDLVVAFVFDNKASLLIQHDLDRLQYKYENNLIYSNSKNNINKRSILIN